MQARCCRVEHGNVNPLAVTEQAFDRRIAQQGCWLACQGNLQPGNVSFRARHDVVHSWLLIGRFGMRPDERQSQPAQPLKRLGRLA